MVHNVYKRCAPPTHSLFIPLIHKIPSPFGKSHIMLIQVKYIYLGLFSLLVKYYVLILFGDFLNTSI